MTCVSSVRLFSLFNVPARIEARCAAASRELARDDPWRRQKPSPRRQPREFRDAIVEV